MISGNIVKQFLYKFTEYLICLLILFLKKSRFLVKTFVKWLWKNEYLYYAALYYVHQSCHMSIC